MSARLRTGLENPLLRAGLALAGANSWLYGRKLPESAGTGFLTGMEIAAMDLRGTDLVVLSACESGMGEIADGQGVLGLRYGVTVAGARGVVMSLWRIPDQATRILMEAFYHHYLTEGCCIPSALRRAQIETRRDHPSIRQWGGFIFSGSSLRQGQALVAEVEDSPDDISVKHQGLRALEQLADVPFDALLREAGMVLTPPPGFRSISLPVDTNIRFHLALRSGTDDIEIRYAIIPFSGRWKSSFSDSDYDHLVFLASNGRSVHPGRFPDEGVQTEFHADLGLATSFQPCDDFCNYFSLGQLVYVKEQRLGVGLICYLCNKLEALLPVITNTEYFTSLRFRPEARSSHPIQQQEILP
jgi:hypothetical protein